MIIFFASDCQVDFCTVTAPAGVPATQEFTGLTLIVPPTLLERTHRQGYDRIT